MGYNFENMIINIMIIVYRFYRTLMKCHNMRHFIWIFTVCKSTCLEKGLILCILGFLTAFSLLTFSKSPFRNSIIMSNNLNSDQARHLFGA